MISVRQVCAGEKQALATLLQDYLREMGRFYPMETDAEGRCAYPYFDLYFSQPDREALWLLLGDTKAGFALLNRHSCLGEPIDYAVAEYYLLPAFRKKRLATAAMKTILGARPGWWEIKYHVRNAAAAALWQRVAMPFSPRRRDVGDECVLTFSVRGESCPGHRA